MHNLSLIVGLLAIFITLLTGLSRWKVLPVFLRIILIQVFIAFGVESYATVMVSKGLTNTALFNGYLLIEVIFFAVAATYLNKSATISRLTAFLIAAFIIAWVGCIARYGWFQFANWAFLTGCLALCILYIYTSLYAVQKYTDKHARRSVIWLCAGVIFYYSCNIPLFAFLNYLIKNQPAIAQQCFIIITVFLSAIRYSCITISLLSFGQSERVKPTTPTRI